MSSRPISTSATKRLSPVVIVVAIAGACALALAACIPGQNAQVSAGAEVRDRIRPSLESDALSDSVPTEPTHVSTTVGVTADAPTDPAPITEPEPTTVPEPTPSDPAPSAAIRSEEPASRAPAPAQESTTTTSPESQLPSASGTEPAPEPEVLRVAAVIEDFETVDVGGALSSGAQCAAAIAPSAETVPENVVANNTVVAAGLVPVNGDERPAAERRDDRIDGNYAGSTNDIIRWGACKWGIDEDTVRAIATAESTWRQSELGEFVDSEQDCAALGKETPCHLSYGLLQVEGATHIGTYPHSEQSTAFGVDYSLAWIRACYEGGFTWLGPDYVAGDLWGCVGAWYSGSWYDDDAWWYLGVIGSELDQRRWENF